MPAPAPHALDQQLVRALAHPLRVEILEALNEREASPNELVEILAEPLGNIAYHARVLEKCGCIEQISTAKRRGAVEHYFRAKPRSHIGHQDWRKVPRSVRSEVSAAALDSFLERVSEAFEAGTIDDRKDTTLSWMVVAVDEVGWEQAVEVLAETRKRLQAVHEESRARLRTSGGVATPMVTGIAGFEAAARSRNGQ